MSDEIGRERPEDEEFSAFLRRHADAYNPPPETPVEAIWEAIVEAREDADHGRDREDGGDDGDVVPIASRRWLLPALAVAAVLILGIAIGRISMRQAGEREAASGPAVATRSAPESSEEDSLAGRIEDGPAPSTAVERPHDPSIASGDLASAGNVPREEAPSLDRQARPDRPGATPEPASTESPSRERESDRARNLYRLASVQMLAQAEALLVDYRSGRASGRGDDAEIGRWADDVLASTRLLLDSRAARDLEMRALLEDLELVLAQIVRYTEADPIEGEMIDRTIEEQDLIPRLRTAIPAGGASSI